MLECSCSELSIGFSSEQLGLANSQSFSLRLTDIIVHESVCAPLWPEQPVDDLFAVWNGIETEDENTTLS